MRVFDGPWEPVTFHDPEGNVLATIDPPMSAEQREAFRRIANSPGPRYSGEQVQAMLLALESEWEKSGGMDERGVQAFVEEWRSRRESA